MMCNGLFSYPIGSLGKDFTDAKTFIEFINRPEVNSYYETIRSYPSRKCIHCPMWTKCGGGCPLLWAVYKADDVIPGW
jgi:radical SAM protein with 4Fe4S-binding SPASM domain